MAKCFMYHDECCQLRFNDTPEEKGEPAYSEGQTLGHLIQAMRVPRQLLLLAQAIDAMCEDVPIICDEDTRLIEAARELCEHWEEHDARMNDRAETPATPTNGKRGSK